MSEPTRRRRDLGKLGGMDPAERLQRQIASERRLFPDEQAPTLAQVAMVLHALADHTLLMRALTFDPDDGPWPQATSVGRFLHAYGDRFDDEARKQLPRLSYYEGWALARVLDGYSWAAEMAPEARERFLRLGLITEHGDRLAVTDLGRLALVAFKDGSVPPR